MKQINLLPSAEQRELRLRFLAGRLTIFWIWIVGSLVVFFVLTILSRIYLQRQSTETQTKIDQNNALLTSSDFKDLQTQILQLNANISEVKNLQTQHYYWSDALIELSNMIPDDMQLNQITFDKTMGKVNVTGQAASRDSVITFWSNVIKSDYFKNINFPLTNLEKSKYPDFSFTFYVIPDKFSTKSSAASVKTQ